MTVFTGISQLNNPYNSLTLNRLSFLSYAAGVLYLLGRLSMRGWAPTSTRLEAENVGIMTCGPISDELLTASDAYWDPDQSEDYLTVTVWITFGLIVAIEAYFVWRLYLLCLGSLSKKPKCEKFFRFFTCCICSHRDFKEVIEGQYAEEPKKQKKPESEKAEEVSGKKGRDVELGDISIDLSRSDRSKTSLLPKHKSISAEEYSTLDPEQKREHAETQLKSMNSIKMTAQQLAMENKAHENKLVR